MARPKRSTKKVPDRAMSKAKRSTKELSYGKAYARLEEILQRLEDGDVDIDELSGLLAEAADIVKLCRAKIRGAKMQVQDIIEQLEREAPVTADEKGEAEEVGSTVTP